MGSAVNMLLEAIGYPERAPDGASSYILQVDGLDIEVEETGPRFMLTYRLSGKDDILPKLAGFAAGRIVREKAVLAADEKGAFLWQDIETNASTRDLQRFVETFADSCDWWHSRVAEGDEEREVNTASAQMMIKP